MNVTVDEYGTGDQVVLLLHGGAGPMSVGGFAQLLADKAGYRVLVPTHPGFGGTPRPAELDSIGGLAGLYRDLLAERDLSDVLVIGNSIGGWIAAELAIAEHQRIGRLVLVDAVGIEVPGEPVADVFGLTLGQLADLSYADPDRFRVDESAFDDAQRAGLAANRAALRTYGGGMGDPTLSRRLAAVGVPTLVVWGEADKVATPAYGRALAAAIPGARFVLLPGTGHVPQIETPDLLLATIVP